MKIKLNVLERITLMNLLPKEENYLTFKLLLNLKSDLSFSDAEYKKAGIQSLPDGRVSWKNGSVTKEIEMPDTITAMIKTKLETLEKEKKINDENVSLYEMFVINRKTED